MLPCSTAGYHAPCAARGRPGGESQGCDSTNLTSLIQAAPSPSVPAQTASRHPACCQETQKDTCSQPLPGQAEAIVADQCPAGKGWAPAAQPLPESAAPRPGSAIPPVPCQSTLLPTFPQQCSAARQQGFATPHTTAPCPTHQPSSMSPQCHPPAWDLGHHSSSVSHHHGQLKHFLESLQLGQAGSSKVFCHFPPLELLCPKICQADALNDQTASATFADILLYIYYIYNRYSYIYVIYNSYIYCSKSDKGAVPRQLLVPAALLCWSPTHSLPEKCFKALLPMEIKFLRHKCNSRLVVLPHALYDWLGAIPDKFGGSKARLNYSSLSKATIFHPII